MPDKDFSPRIIIEGHEHKDWLRYSVDSDLQTPADAWQMSLGAPAGMLPSYVRPWAKVEVRLGDALVMTGRIDALSRRMSKRECVLDVEGRDLAAVLLDCSAPIFTQRKATLQEICATCVRPLGIEKIVVSGDGAFKKVAVEPGATAWDALQEAAEASGLWPWFQPNGTLIVGKPDYSAPVAAELILSTAGDNTTKTNVLDLSVRDSCERTWSEVTVLGQSSGDEEDEGDNTVKHCVKHPSVTYHRPLIRVEGKTDDTSMADRQAQKLMDEGVMSSCTITARVQGHTTEKGILWEPGQRVHVKVAPLGIDKDMLLMRRTFQGGREGSTTTLALKPWGVWLAKTGSIIRADHKEEVEE